MSFTAIKLQHDETFQIEMNPNAIDTVKKLMSLLENDVRILLPINMKVNSVLIRILASFFFQKPSASSFNLSSKLVTSVSTHRMN